MYIEEGRDHVWRWYISNLIQPLRLSQNPMTRLVGNPPWVVYNAMNGERQDAFREQAQVRKVWAGANLATQNDLAATFVATCVDYYLQPGGKFGFVLPYAALRARHWEPFRSGQWSLPETAGRRPTLVDLGKAAWDLTAVNAPPFPQANSSVIFGDRLSTEDRRREVSPKPLADSLAISNDESINPRMPWSEVQSRLKRAYREKRQTATNEAYSDAFRNGATLFPQPLVVFEKAKSLGLGKVYFRTNSGKGAWNGLERDGRVEERFVRPALFSRLLLPFGITALSNVIAPFSEDGRSLDRSLPQGEGAAEFRQYWDLADRDWRKSSGPRPPHSLLDQVDYQGKLSAQLANEVGKCKVVYRKSGQWLSSAVVESRLIADGTLYWYSSPQGEELHYLAAVFNAPCLADFFSNAGRLSDRDFHTGPVRNLPIPAYDPGNADHANLAAQSELAHEQVAALVAERQAGGRKITRNDVLRDQAMQPILARIDESARAILPDYCS
jgi:hypothetical protein